MNSIYLFNPNIGHVVITFHKDSHLVEFFHILDYSYLNCEWHAEIFQYLTTRHDISNFIQC